MTGLTLDMFHKLVAKFTPHMANKFTHGKNLLNLKEVLLLTLMWFRTYVSQYFLAWIFGISQTTVQRYIATTIDIMYDVYSKEIKFDSEQQRYDNSKTLRGEIITVIIDGTEQQVGTPNNKQKEQELFSGKKQLHTFTLLLVCSPYGKIYFISLSYSGSKNDMSMIHLQENAFWHILNGKEYICGDKGFKGLQNFYSKVAIPIIGEVSEKEKLFNNELSSIRIVVENVFAHLKKWKICRYPLRTNINNIEKAKLLHHQIWTIVGGLYNDFFIARQRY